MTPCSMAIVMGFVEGFQDLRLFLTALKNDVVDAEKKLMWLEDCPRCCELRQRLCFIYWHDDFPPHWYVSFIAENNHTGSQTVPHTWQQPKIHSRWGHKVTGTWIIVPGVESYIYILYI
jgi:hypothetical protein